MCVVIYLCLTSDSFPPCGRNSHVTARNTAVDPRDLSCNIKTHHVSSEPKNISWLYTSFFFGVAIHTTAAVLLYTGLWTSVSKPMFLRRPLDSSLPCRQPQPYFFFPFYVIETKDYENPRNANKFRPNETIAKWIPRRGSSDGHVEPSGEHLPSSNVSRVQFLVF